MSEYPHNLEQDLVDALHRAALDPAGWQDFIRQLESALPSVGGSIFGVEENGHRLTYVASGEGLDPGGLDHFVRYYHAISPFAGFLAGLTPGAAQLTAADLSDEAIERTEFYNDWMRHQDVLIGGVALKSRPYGSRSLVVAINVRRKGREEMDRRTHALLTRLEPHISHAFRMSEVVAELNGRILATAMAGDGPVAPGGIIITDGDLFVAWAEPGALAMMGDVLRIDMVGRLSFADPRAQSWATGIASRSLAGQPASGTIRTQGGGGWTIQAASGGAAAPTSPLFPGAYRGRGWPERQIAFVMSPGRQALSTDRRLSDRFRLSPAEAAVALLVAEGRSTAEIAAARQASAHTIRNQIRAVLHKMEVRQRSDVVRIVMSAINRQTGKR